MALSLTPTGEPLPLADPPVRRAPPRLRVGRAEGRAWVDFGDGLPRHCAEIAATLPTACGLTVTCEVVDLQLPRVVATRIYVIALELIESGLAAFEGGRGGRIALAFRCCAGALELVVEHSSCRKPPARGSAGVGAAVVQAVVAELGGRIEQMRMLGGARTIVTVPWP